MHQMYHFRTLRPFPKDFRWIELFTGQQTASRLFMVALWNRETIYIFILFISFFFLA